MEPQSCCAKGEAQKAAALKDAAPKSAALKTAAFNRRPPASRQQQTSQISTKGNANTGITGMPERGGHPRSPSGSRAQPFHLQPFKDTNRNYQRRSGRGRKTLCTIIEVRDGNDKINKKTTEVIGYVNRSNTAKQQKSGSKIIKRLSCNNKV